MVDMNIQKKAVIIKNSKNNVVQIVRSPGLIVSSDSGFTDGKAHLAYQRFYFKCVFVK
jgi:hypothetical protein